MFIHGINYWPINKAMYWWKEFEPLEVARDFERLSEYFNVVRIFLVWEDFQPEIDRIDEKRLKNLVTVADIASDHGLQIMPTFFCGHMSGVNWMPRWMLQASQSSFRFPVYSDGHIITASIRNFYAEPELAAAQVDQIRAVCNSLAGHPAINAYDLGNEPSNCVHPPDRETGCQWLQTMCDAIHSSSGGTPVTIGMHAEDLEEDRQMWPQDAAQSCDFLCMHGYPFYLSWIESSLDTDLAPFLGLLTQYLGQKEVLFQEFGIPTHPVIPPFDASFAETPGNIALFSEQEAENYYRSVLGNLEAAGMTGGMAWCFADYTPDKWHEPPLHQNVHERHFGLFRHNGTSKGALETFNLTKAANNSCRQEFLAYLQRFDRDRFYDHPLETLPQLFAVYKKMCKGND